MVESSGHRQYERRASTMNQQFDQAQQDPAFLEWLQAMDDELGRFLAEDAPAIGDLADPYTADGLAVCEDVIRDRLGSIHAIDDPANARLVDRFVRFIGEVHRRATEARWVNVAHMREAGPVWPQILRPFSEWAVDPRAQIGGAFAKKPQQPTQLVWVLNNMLTEYTRWVEYGRPKPEEYQRLYTEQLVAETDGNDL
ncbi:hypothetical protein [Nocardia sp. NPDC002869]|uniref:hypothetical protein n=1 Tax=Nocardia sp. NPDC002869 TaxID=3161032 RepID=UPI00398D688A